MPKSKVMDDDDFVKKIAAQNKRFCNDLNSTSSSEDILHVEGRSLKWGQQREHQKYEQSHAEGEHRQHQQPPGDVREHSEPRLSGPGTGARFPGSSLQEREAR